MLNKNVFKYWPRNKKNILEDEAIDPLLSFPLEITQSLDLPQYVNIHVRRMNTTNTNAAYHCIKY